MYKITKTLPTTYSEIGQTNPLRWEILFRNDEESFTSQSGLIKCKDFFNELVRKHVTGKDTGIYGFTTNNISFNEEGMYFRMHLTFPFEVFETNINNTLGTSNNSDEHVVVEDLGEGKALLFMPIHYFTSTYLMSLVSFIIRCCHAAETYESLDVLLDNTKDVAINNQGMTLAKKWKLDVPEEFKGFWYYAGKQDNSQIQPDPTYTSLVHNNGVMGWANGGAV
jgi:hypothetical protein